MSNDINPAAPERMFGWMNSQFSIARFAGGCTYQGHEYVIDYGAEGQPLVRADVLQAEQKALRLANKADKAARKQEAQAAKGGKA